jgi:tetratricopeptide (TPR) repeat protein
MRWCSLVLLLVAAGVSAEPRSRADQRFEEGRKLMDAGKYAEACTAFEDSQQLDPAVTTLLNLGACREKAGQLASAVAVYRAAERTTSQDGTKAAKELAQIAAGHARRLELRVSSLTIVVPRERRIDGLTIERGGAAVEPMEWNVPQPIDGGRYTIVARAPGHVEWSTTIVIARERDTKTIRVPELVVGTSASDTDEIDEPPPAAAARLSLAWPIAFTVGALASGGTAYWFSRRGDDIYAEAQREPDPTRQTDLWQRANRQRYMAQGLAVTGVACAAVAVWLFVRRGSNRGADGNDGVALRPVVHDGGVTVHLVGSY